MKPIIILICIIVILILCLAMMISYIRKLKHITDELFSLLGTDVYCFISC